jgi:hypothetical protein
MSEDKKRKVGRPKEDGPKTKEEHIENIKKRYQKWTPERLEKIAVEMLEWFKEDEDRFTLQGFLGSREDFVPYHGVLQHFADRSEFFSSTLLRVKNIIADRILKNGMYSKSVSGPAFKMISMNMIEGWKNPDEKSTTIISTPQQISWDGPNVPPSRHLDGDGVTTVLFQEVQEPPDPVVPVPDEVLDFEEVPTFSGNSSTDQ